MEKQAIEDNPKSLRSREGAHHVLHDIDRADWDEILRPVIIALEGMEPSLEVPIASRKALNEIEKVKSF